MITVCFLKTGLNSCVCVCVCVRACVCVCVCVCIYILYMYRKYCLLYFISTKPIFLTDNERKQIEMCWTLTKFDQAKSCDTSAIGLLINVMFFALAKSWRLRLPSV